MEKTLVLTLTNNENRRIPMISNRSYLSETPYYVIIARALFEYVRPGRKMNTSALTRFWTEIIKNIPENRSIKKLSYSFDRTNYKKNQNIIEIFELFEKNAIVTDLFFLSELSLLINEFKDNKLIIRFLEEKYLDKNIRYPLEILENIRLDSKLCYLIEKIRQSIESLKTNQIKEISSDEADLLHKLFDSIDLEALYRFKKESGIMSRKRYQKTENDVFHDFNINPVQDKNIG